MRTIDGTEQIHRGMGVHKRRRLYTVVNTFRRTVDEKFGLYYCKRQQAPATFQVIVKGLICNEHF